jgi:hypothetical protein
MVEGQTEGLVAVVARLPGGGFGVRVMDVRSEAVIFTLAPDEWRALLPRIQEACDLAEKPGELP